MSQEQNLTNIEAEQALLGAILVNNDAFLAVDGLVTSEDFAEAIHRRIYDAIAIMVGANSKASPVTLKASISYTETIGNDLTVGAYVARLAASAVTVRDAPDYAKAIRQYSIRRSLFSIAHDLMNTASRDMPMPDLWEALDGIDARMADATVARSQKQIGTAGDIYLDSLNESVKKKNVSGVPINFTEIREVLSEESFEGGNLYGLLAASGEGKTSMVLQIIAYALHQGNPVLFLSYDQSIVQCMRQMVSQEYGISAKRQRNGEIQDFEYKKAFTHSRWINSVPFELIKCDTQTANQLAQLVKRFCRKHERSGKTPLIVIDHIMRIAVDDKSARDEGARARASTTPLKAVAGLTNSAVLLLNQRNGGGSMRDNPRPIKRDLYGGEAAQYDYDAIMYLYRLKKWREEKRSVASRDSDHKMIDRVFGTSDEDITEIGALKVRFGSSYEKSRMKFNPDYTRYEHIAVPELIEDPMRPTGRLL